MLCTVALRRTLTGYEGDSYTLRIVGKTALGPSGTGGQDAKDGLSAEDVHATLRSLGLGEGAVAVATAIMNNPRDTGRFTPIAEGVQIPFSQLEAAEFYLFD